MHNPQKQQNAPYEFCLSTTQYDAFLAALDASPKPRPRLEKLLTMPSVFEQAGREHTRTL